MPGLGWRRDSLDPRDFRYSAPPPILTALPPTFDLRKTGFLPPIYDQGQIGSCTANAIAAAMQFDRAAQKIAHAELVPSRLMIYYLEREIEGSIASDAGAQIRDGIKAMAKTGACFESGPAAWPYDITKFTQRPPPACYAVAKKDEAVSYARVTQNIQQLRGAIVAGFPFVFGFLVYEEFESAQVAKTGKVPMPKSSQRPIGGHAVLAVGYDDVDRNFLVRNSWGLGWGIHGHFLMPYDYLNNPELASDFWQISAMTP